MNYVKAKLPECAYKDHVGFEILFKEYLNVSKYDTTNISFHEFYDWNSLVEFSDHIKQNNECIDGLYFCPSTVVYSYFKPTLEFVKSNVPTGFTKQKWILVIKNTDY